MTVGLRQDVVARLAELVGDEHVVTADEDVALLSTDLGFVPGEVALAAVRPGTVEELAACVAAATSAGHPVVPRGGGMSYTGGFQPARPGSVIVDTRRLDRIVEVDETDLTVTVEVGVTWERLYEALRAQGLRTPYFGPISGRHATVGGTLAQNSLFYGSARYGMAADWVTSLDVVLADGRVLTTGSAAHANGTPFFRWYGPDLSSLFLGDTGAFGIKARATLQLIPFPAHTGFASFGFATLEQQAAAMREIARLDLAAEVYGLDPYFHGVMARLGLEDMLAHPWSLHVVVDGASEALVAAALDAIRPLGLREGTAIATTVAEAVRADPFGGFGVLGDAGEVWVPIHCFLPWSKAEAAFAATRRVLDEAADRIAAVGMATSTLTACARNAFVYEPCFWWPDEVDGFRLGKVDEQARAAYGGRRPNPEARALYVELRRRLADAYAGLGAAHIQIGKYYAFERVLRPPAFDVLRQVKDALDPHGLVNPGSLGLGS